MTLAFPVIFYRNILTTTILCSLLAIAGLIKWRSGLTLGIFILGFFFGTISEMIATQFGVWEYAFPSFLNIPLWLFVVWGNAAAFIYQTAIEFERLGLHR